MDSNTQQAWAEDDSTKSVLNEVLSEADDLCTLEENLRKEIEQKKIELDTLMKRYKQLVEQDLPELLMSNGLDSVTTANGIAISMSKTYHPHIKKDNWQTAKAWLINQGDDTMIKTKLTQTFGAGEEEMRKSILAMEALLNANIDYSLSETIHPQTLKAYVKRKIESGEEIPQDLFGVHVATVAKIKQAK